VAGKSIANFGFFFEPVCVTTAVTSGIAGAGVAVGVTGVVEGDTAAVEAADEADGVGAL
jgi:hypothetical protein